MIKKYLTKALALSMIVSSLAPMSPVHAEETCAHTNKIPAVVDCQGNPTEWDGTICKDCKTLVDMILPAGMTLEDVEKIQGYDVNWYKSLERDEAGHYIYHDTSYAETDESPYERYVEDGKHYVAIACVHKNDGCTYKKVTEVSQDTCQHDMKSTYTTLSCETPIVKTTACTKCGKEESKEEIMKAPGHLWTEPQLVIHNSKYYLESKCTRKNCGEIKDVEVTQENCIHTLGVKHNVVAATCTGAGIDKGDTCIACDKVLTEEKELPALGHKWDDGKITEYPTTLKTGVKEYKCTRKGCKEVKTEVLDKIDTLNIKLPKFHIKGDSQANVLSRELKADISLKITDYTVASLFHQIIDDATVNDRTNLLRLADAIEHCECADNVKEELMKSLDSIIIDFKEDIKVKGSSVSLKKHKKSVTVKLSKSADATGYQISYGKCKTTKFNKVTNVKKLSKKFNAKKKTKYYVKVRAYKVVPEHYTNGVFVPKQTVYSKWSKVKTFKLK